MSLTDIMSAAAKLKAQNGGMGSAELASVHAAMHRAESRHDVPVGTA